MSATQDNVKILTHILPLPTYFALDVQQLHDPVEIKEHSYKHVTIVRTQHYLYTTTEGTVNS